MAWLVVVLSVLGTVSAACGGADEGAGRRRSGSTTTAVDRTGAPTDAEIAALSSPVSGGGASFPDAYYQAANADFNGLAGRELVTYAKSGSSDGRRQLAEGTVDLAGSDSLPKPEETWPSTLLLFPTVAAPITIAYHLDGVDRLRLSPDTIAGIFQAEITTWDAPAIAADNPGTELPSQAIKVIRRSDGSGTTNNFTTYLTSAAPTAWKLGSGDLVDWPASTQGMEKNSGVAAMVAQTAGSIGYVDLADAVKADLDTALIRNGAGSFVAPTAESTAAAVAAAEVADDLSYDPLNAPGADSYPITAPTYLMVLQSQPDPDTAATVKAYLRYLLSAGQEQASLLGFVGPPESLRQEAYDQVDRIRG